jgi:death-on-curing protein
MIIELNRDMITKYSGLYLGENNLKFPEILDWVLDCIQYPIFDTDMYPTIVDKAARLGWAIGAEHVFHDGNKRTSTVAVLSFLRMNGFDYNASRDELIEIALKVATNKEVGFTLDDYGKWLDSHIVLRGTKSSNFIAGWYY